MRQRRKDASKRRARRAWPAWQIVAALLALAPARLSARCVGDCDGDGMVELNEVITGVGIALDSRDLADCAAFDSDDSSSVDVTELIGGVDNSLNDGCAATSPTPTATVSPTPTLTPTPTVISELCGNGQIDESEECDDGKQCDDGTTDCTDDPAVCAGIVNGVCAPRRGDGCQDNCKLSRCGDGITDNLIEDPENCDDGNTVEGIGDTCPANCRVAACTPSTTLRANVDFTTQEAGTFIVGMEIFLRYPEGLVSIPGSSGDPVVRQAVQSETFSVTPNDVNFALTAVLSGGATAGTAFTVDFQRCEGAALPSPSDFTCTVGVASDDSLNDVTDQVSCSVVFP
jgi:cysteine-rich repeat protein